jgi:hypothetical protein
MAAFSVLALFLGIRWGYSKRDRQLVRERKKFYKEMESRIPRAIRK